MRNETLKSALGLVPVLIVCYLLQSAVFSPLHEKGCAPQILPLVAVGVGLLGNVAWGGAFGLLAGILCDASLGSLSLPFTVALTALGFFSGFLGDCVLARSLPSYLLLSLCTLLICALVEMLPLLLRHGQLWPLAATALKQTGVSLLFCVPVFVCVRRALRAWLRARSRGLTERSQRET